VKRLLLALALVLSGAAAEAQIVTPPAGGGASYDGGSVTNPFLSPDGSLVAPGYGFTDHPAPGAIGSGMWYNGGVELSDPDQVSFYVETAGGLSSQGIFSGDSYTISLTDNATFGLDQTWNSSVKNTVYFDAFGGSSTVAETVGSFTVTETDGTATSSFALLTNQASHSVSDGAGNTSTIDAYPGAFAGSMGDGTGSSTFTFDGGLFQTEFTASNGTNSSSVLIEPGAVTVSVDGNEIAFPSTAGTVALTSDIPAAATRVTLASNLTTTATNPGVTSTLTFTPTASKVYAIRGEMYMSSTTAAAGVGFGETAPTADTLTGSCWFDGAASGTSAFPRSHVLTSAATDYDAISASQGIDVPQVIRFNCVMVVGANVTTGFILNFGNETGETTTLYAGSYLEYNLIP
jgi:hypothetical protein